RPETTFRVPAADRRTGGSRRRLFSRRRLRGKLSPMPVRAATLLAAVLLGSACGREPEIAGEPLSVHVERLASGPAHVRLRALRVLGGAGRDASQAVPAIAGCLADPDRSVQAAAAEALGAIGDARAQTALLRALGDPDLSAQAFDAAADAAARSVPAAEL